VGLCCESLAAELTTETTLGCTTSPALALGFVFIFVFGFVFGLALALGFLALPWLLFSWGQLFQKNGRTPRRERLFAAQQ
jgi:predicted membrane metal-binding protein